MPTQILTAESASEKAWHILAVLLSLRRSARPAEIAARCTLFHATPELIQSLCLIPNSPISLSGDLYVTISQIALTNLAEILSKNISIFDDLTRRPEVAPQAEDSWRMIFTKRKRPPFDDTHGYDVPLRKRNRNATKVLYITDGISRSIKQRQSDISVIMTQPQLKSPSIFRFSNGQLSCKLKEIVHLEGAVGMGMSAHEIVPKRLTADKFASDLALPTGLPDLNISTSIDPEYYLDDMKQNSTVALVTEIVSHTYNSRNAEISECNRTLEGEEREQFTDIGSTKGNENCLLPLDTILINKPSFGNERDITMDKVAVVPAAELSVTDMQLMKSSAKTKFLLRDGMDPKMQALSESSAHNKAHNTTKEKKQVKRDQISVIMEAKARGNESNTKDQRGNFSSVSPKDQTKTKALPNFESYIVEEEEGSGGYGTVYRARRKNGGTLVAIKCPHANANKHHVNNEMRMLERFGGKNFIIKYENCFKSGNSDCLVLEHVEHDRPEILKKEIELSQLQWYGYCMFRALASLHKQGIVHRDVKPGNFLFSRKATKGYLIDFNLAVDLHQKHGTINKLKAGFDASLNHATRSGAKNVNTASSRKIPIAKSQDPVKQDARKASNLESRNLKRKAPGQTNVYNDLGSRKIINSQGADGSGITSAKEATSTRNPSGERMREPLPCQGRKELISLLHKALQNPNYEAFNYPAPMRKRVAAPPGKVGREFVYVTPMPLNSNDIAVAGAGAGLTNKGNGKHKKDGPCAGTKGFRAPEVLFRSQHQGPKLDIWSAGVTLLYLMIGRSPFFGDPDQNIKEIAKLKGTEDLWEVSKLHNCEASFPEELYDAESLTPINLLHWCKLNTKRPDFLEVIPSSLFDLVDKCLTVNPRLRLSAEEALKHEFFAPCREMLKKQKLLRQEPCLDSTTSNPLRKQSIARPLKISQ